MNWMPIHSAPTLEAVLTCQTNKAKSVRQMYYGDGSAKYPATWICEITREPVSEFEIPDWWMPTPDIPGVYTESKSVQIADRKVITDTFIRICSDSRFQWSATEAAKFTAKLLGIHPLEVSGAFASLQQMGEVAAGTHPAATQKDHV